MLCNPKAVLCIFKVDGEVPNWQQMGLGSFVPTARTGYSRKKAEPSAQVLMDVAN